MLSTHTRPRVDLLDARQSVRAGSGLLHGTDCARQSARPGSGLLDGTDWPPMWPNPSENHCVTNSANRLRRELEWRHAHPPTLGSRPRWALC